VEQSVTELKAIMFREAPDIMLSRISLCRRRVEQGIIIGS